MEESKETGRRSLRMSRRRALGIFGSVPAAAWLAGCAGESDGASVGAALTNDPPTDPTSAATDFSSESVFRTTREGDKIVIECSGIPNHETGAFPNAACPFGIKGRRRRFEISAHPVTSASPRAIAGWLFGVAVNGVVLDPTGPWLYEGDARTAYEFEVMSRTARRHLGLDANNAHSQPGGEYHYHGLPIGLLDVLRAEGRMLLVGWAADGFPIYGPFGHADADDPSRGVRAMRSSYRLARGERPDVVPGGTRDGTFVEDFEYVPGLGDLDECNGRFGVTPEFPEGVYHYHLTSAFPFVPRYWRGEPDPTFAHPSPGPDAVPRALRNYRGTISNDHLWGGK